MALLPARVALATGDTASARTSLRTVIELWEHADPPFLPRVDAAKAQLAKLGGR